MKTLLRLGLWFVVTVTCLPAQVAGVKPAVWMGPPSYDNGRCFRELFEKPDAWKETRSMIDVLFYSGI